MTLPLVTPDTEKQYSLSMAFSSVMLLSVSLISVANASAPSTSDPSGRLVPGFDAPGEFPATVSAANLNFSPLPGVEFGGTGEDFLKAEFPSSGPIPWTTSRYNAGDITLLVGPADPSNALSFPVNDFVEKFQALDENPSAPIDTNSHELTALSWLPDYRTGALLATTRHNGIDSGYTIPGTGGAPLGSYHGVTYFGTFGGGWGFQTADGSFGKPNRGELAQGLAGIAVLPGPTILPINEVAFDAAVAYLPYEQGWTGGWVQSATNGPGSFFGASPNVTSANVTWTAGQADISLPGVNSATDGMLFVAPSENESSDTKIASAFPNDSGGWTTSVRFDYLSVDGTNFTPESVLTFQNEFQFLYIPFDSQNFIGGHIDGPSGNTINGAGESQFDLTRTASGQYALSILETDGITRKTEDDGVLLLSVADTFAGNANIGSQAMLSYEYDDTSGDFIVESRILVNPFSTTPNGSFANEFQLTDADFYFTWVDFENPLAPPAPSADYSGDGFVNGTDLAQWQGDFGINGESDADGDVDSDGADFLEWQRQFGEGVSPVAASAAVPEPTTVWLLLISALFAPRLHIASHS